jgi:hypothetical protein
VATGRYFGEGFDDARLDTPFLTMPISWRGILARHAGRLHRLYPTKRGDVLYDYVDGSEPMLAKMAKQHEAGYHSLGYRMIDASELGSPPTQVSSGSKRMASCSLSASALGRFRIIDPGARSP